MANVCLKCHSKVDDATVAEHRHKVLDATMNCMLCHKPHSSDQDNLMRKDEVALCSQCHKLKAQIGVESSGKSKGVTSLWVDKTDQGLSASFISLAIGGLGQGAGDLTYPSGIAGDGSTLIFVVESTGARVQAFELMPDEEGR